jgi:ABC-type polysaccharide/polyol phosphate transport system ATPase subunit
MLNGLNMLKRIIRMKKDETDEYADMTQLLVQSVRTYSQYVQRDI